ncbi:MAG: hypothetical protein IKH86_07675 [Prevotella sp.]|nr:hypothetical protein [Prevotella sp.]
MEENKTNFYEDDSNYMFVKKGNDGQLLDYLFIHLSDSGKPNFLVHFDSFVKDNPLEVFKIERIDLKDDGTCLLSSAQISDFKEEQNWKRVKVCGMLPSKWRMLFEEIEDTLNKQ